MIPNVTLPIGEKGSWSIEKVSFTGDEVFNRLQALKHGRYIPEGEYTFLKFNNKIVMSDTPDEKRDHWEPVHKAQGHILIAGLGLGMVLQACAKKPDVEKITVVEVSQDLIDLVGPHYEKMFPGKLEIVCADIYDWKPPKGIIYNVAWYDIWNDMCEDNLPLMTKLHRKFAKRVKWQGSWSKEYLLYKRSRNRGYY